MDKKVDYLENQSRRNNLIFDGITEEFKESWADSERKVCKVLKDNLQIQDRPVIERAHRVGRIKPERNRPIVVKFLNYKDRESILLNARKLRGTSYSIREDLSEKVLAKRREQMPQFKEARDAGKVAYFNYDRLVIKERSQPPGTMLDRGAANTTHKADDKDDPNARRATRSQSVHKT